MRSIPMDRTDDFGIWFRHDERRDEKTLDFALNGCTVNSNSSLWVLVVHRGGADMGVVRRLPQEPGDVWKRNKYSREMCYQPDI